MLESLALGPCFISLCLAFFFRISLVQGLEGIDGVRSSRPRFRGLVRFSVDSAQRYSGGVRAQRLSPTGAGALQPPAFRRMRDTCPWISPP